MDGERQRWLVRVIEASAQAAERLEASADPFLRGLHADVLELHDRLRAELDGAELDG